MYFFFIAFLFVSFSFASHEEDFKKDLENLKGYVTGPKKEVFDKALALAADPLFFPMLKKLKSP